MLLSVVVAHPWRTADSILRMATWGPPRCSGVRSSFEGTTWYVDSSTNDWTRFDGYLRSSCWTRRQRRTPACPIRTRKRKKGTSALLAWRAEGNGSCRGHPLPLLLPRPRRLIGHVANSPRRDRRRQCRHHWQVDYPQHHSQKEGCPRRRLREHQVREGVRQAREANVDGLQAPILLQVEGWGIGKTGRSHDGPPAPQACLHLPQTCVHCCLWGKVGTQGCWHLCLGVAL